VIVDLLVLVYVTFTAWRGRKHGLAKELPGAFSITVFAVTGWGLFKIMFRGLSEAGTLTSHSAPLLTFTGLVAGSVYLWRKVNARVRWIAEKWPNEHTQRLGGGIAGGVRAFVLCATLLLILAHWPLHKMTCWIAESSMLGRALIKFVLPVYEKTHGAL
jgi:uncharacterized membrane protein required for colicin V production